MIAATTNSATGGPPELDEPEPEPVDPWTTSAKSPSDGEAAS